MGCNMYQEKGYMQNNCNLTPERYMVALAKVKKKMIKKERIKRKNVKSTNIFIKTINMQINFLVQTLQKVSKQ